jgi:hypothetical protein
MPRKDPKGHLDSFNLGNGFTCHTSSSKAFWKKEEAKVGELKGTPKTLIPSLGVQNLTKGEKLEGKPKRDKLHTCGVALLTTRMLIGTRSDQKHKEPLR